MSIFTITGADTLTLNGRVINDLALDDVTTITFPETLINVKSGKNGNTIYAQNAPGHNAEMQLHLSRGSSDDQFLQALISNSPSDFPSTQLLTGTFVKRLGDGQGNVISDTYSLAGGVVVKNIEAKDNVDGDVTQGESMYTLKFAKARRSIG